MTKRDPFRYLKTRQEGIGLAAMLCVRFALSFRKVDARYLNTPSRSVQYTELSCRVEAYTAVQCSNPSFMPLRQCDKGNAASTRIAMGFQGFSINRLAVGSLIVATCVVAFSFPPLRWIIEIAEIEIRNRNNPCTIFPNLPDGSSPLPDDVVITRCDYEGFVDFSWDIEATGSEASFRRMIELLETKLEAPIERNNRNGPDNGIHLSSGADRIGGSWSDGTMTLYYYHI